MRRLVPVVVVMSLAGAATAAPRWTFCVARAGGGSEVWISDVFAELVSREALEGAFKDAIGRLGAADAEALCPSPRADRAVAAAALDETEAFNRQIGAKLHVMEAGAFPASEGPRR
jgi:hypothetical protein